MKLPELSIKNRQFTIILFLLALLIGVHSILNMPRSEDPPIVIPGAIIKVTYPGASPEDMEELVINPIEDAIKELDDIDKISSTAANNFSVVIVDFEYGGDTDAQYDDVVEKINSIRKDLPGLIESIDIDKKETSDVVVLQYALISEYADFEVLRFEAERLEETLENVNGIKKADIYALPDREIRISMDIPKMSQMTISIDDVSNALQSNNANIPGGDVNVGKKNFNIRTSGSYKSLDEIRNTVVGSYSGKLIYLKNIADVNFRHKDNNYFARYNGQRCVFVAAEQKIGVNVVQVINDAKEKLKQFETELPQDIILQNVVDKSVDVKSAINTFLSNLFQGILIVSVLVMFAIGFRLSLVAIIAIPSSVLIGLGVLDYSGYGLQSISIAGLIISLGLLVDNAIVVAENALRFMQMGDNSRTAAIKGTRQVGRSLVSSTLTTILAFLPIIMMTDAAGDFTISMPIVVIAVLLTSLVLALTVSPVLIEVLYKKQTAEKRVLKEQPLQKLLEKFISGRYKKILAAALNKPRRTLFYAFLFLISSFLVSGKFLKTSFFGDAEKAQFLIRVKASDASNIYHTDSIVHIVEAILDTTPGIKHFAANVGHGNPKVYNNLIVEENKKDFGEIFVKLDSYKKEEYNTLLTGLRKKFDVIPNTDIRIKEMTQGVPSTYPLEIILTGKKTNTLLALSEDIEEIISNQEGTINVENELKEIRTDLQVSINKNKAGLLGISTADIDLAIRTAMTGSEIGTYLTDNGDELNIIISLPIDGQRALNDLDKIYVESVLGKLIPLKQIAKIEFDKNKGKITHYNTTRSATIGADIAKGYNVSEVTALVKQRLLEYRFPKGYSFKIAGEVENQSSAFGSLAISALVAFFGILLVLVLQFKSLKQTFIIFSAIPLAFSGSLYMLLITGNSFSFTAFVGLVSLMGIVINDSILLVDFANEQLREEKNIHEAVLYAGQVRFVPVLMTSLTTICGLFTLAFSGSSLWEPMAWTIIGGLSLSTVLVLVIVPVLYQQFTKVKN